MTAQYNPKTLAKTLSTLAWHVPAEYGLYWDADGTMPWKELYWVLQEDASLRFVRENTIRELTGLGLDLPFALDGTRLRLHPDCKQPAYPLADKLPDRLYVACRRKRYADLLEHGLTPSDRSLVRLCATKELALRLGRRRDPEPLLIEVLAAQALVEGVPIFRAGGDLYLATTVSRRHLLFPLLRADRLASPTSRKKAEAKPSHPDAPPTPGSFFVDVHTFEGHPSGKNEAGKAGRQPRKKKQDWKRDAKKERHKRSV